jgi:hypothetical protein
VGLSCCLEQGRLLSDGGTLDLSDFDVDALRIAEQALTRRTPVLVCPPDPFAPLSALVAAAAHVTAMVSAFRESGRAAPSPLRIAVVTADFRLRGFYRGLAVAWRRGVGGVPMRSIVPAATIVSGGRLSVVDSDTGCWSTVFVKTVAEAEALGPVNLLVVDLPVPDAARLGGLSVPMVVIARDPLDSAAGALAAQLPAFGYDSYLRDWHRDPGDAPPLLRLANHRDRRVKVIAVPAPVVCDNAALFWDDVPTLVRLGRRSPYVAALIREAFTLFHDLLGLAMPLAMFTKLTAKPLDSRIADLARAAKAVADTELRQDWLPMIEAELGGILASLHGSAAANRRLGAGNGAAGKAAALLASVAEALDDRRDVLVITRTASLARAYSEYLCQCHLGAARVTSLGALADVAPGDLAVLLGMAPTWGRWVYRSGAGGELAVLAYTPGPDQAKHAGHDGAAVTVGRRFDEAEMVATAIGRQDAAGLRLSDPAQRTRAWASLRSGSADGGVSGRTDGDGLARPGGVMITEPVPPEVPPGLWDGTGWIAPLEPDGASDTPTTGTGRIGDTSPGFRATFADGSWAWLAERGLVWRWRPHAGRPEQIEASRLAVGDELVFIDGDAHKTLLAKLLDVAENIPGLAVGAGWHGHWRAVLQHAHERSGSYNGLARTLATVGCRVQGQTVRLWCVGVTIGPDDFQDLQRVGQIAEDPVLLTQGAEVWRAMQTLRNAHVKVGKRLAALARAIGPAAGAGRLPADEVIDPVSGLTAGDLGTAVTMLRVTRLERMPAVPDILAGTRRRPGDPVDIFTTEPASEGRPS